MAAPGQNEPIIYNESDGQTDPRAAINTGSNVGSVDKANREHEKNVTSKIKEGDIKGVTSKLSMIPKYHLDADRVEQAMNPQYRKQNEDVENPNMKKDATNTMDASGQVTSNTENKPTESTKDTDRSLEDISNQHLPSQEQNTAFRSATRGDVPSSEGITRGTLSDSPVNNDEDKFKKVLDNAVDGTGPASNDENKFKNVLDNAVDGTGPASNDENKFKNVLDNAADAAPLAAAGDMLTNIGNQLPTLTRHGKIMEQENDNLAVNNEEEMMNMSSEQAEQDSTRAIPPSSKLDNSTVASAAGVADNKKESSHKLDSSVSAAAQAQVSAKGSVDVDSNNEPTNWKSPSLKYRQPLKPATPDTIIFYLQRKALKYIVISCVICYFFGKLGFGWIAGLLSICGGAFAWWRLGTEAKQGIEWQMEKDEAMKTLYTSEGETVEWLNYCVEKIWRSIDPQMFVQVEDILEDTLESLAPGFIKGVKVTDFDIGVQAPRVQMIRIFPPLPGQPDESIFGEASFSFHAHPVASISTTRHSLSAPPGIGIRFKTGIKAALDIKAELTALSGKIRFKILTSPEMPFVSKVTIAFTSVPIIETGVMPVSKHMNIMHLPLIKTLVNEGVKLGFAGLVDPKSLTLDIQALMGAAAHDTSAIGVVKVDFIEAIRTSKSLQDMEDSYASLSLSNSPGRSMTTTRVLTNDKDPRWNESLFLLVHEDDIVSDNQVELKVWDADKIKFDDVWGHIGIPVKDIVLAKTDKLGNVSDWCADERQVFDGWSPIDGAKDLESSQIKLHYRVSWHPKYIAAKPKIMERNKPEIKDNQPSSSDTAPSQKDEETVEVDVAHSSGILSITLHQAIELEVADQQLIDNQEKHPYNASTVVSPYALVYINDEKVFRTRSKMRNPSPHWNAVTEHFIRDYRSTFIRVSVKHSVDLERDPVLGTRVINLEDAFENQKDDIKEVQRWLPIKDGIGFGKILVTLRYKPVKLSLPKPMTGSRVGTLVIDRIVFNGLQPPFSNSIKSLKAVLAANVEPGMSKNLKARDCDQQNQPESSGNVVSWSGKRLYFPITMRYRTAIYVHLSAGGVSSKRITGRLWLRDLVDDEQKEFTIGLHPGMDHKSKEANRNTDDWEAEGDFGTCQINCLFIPGYSSAHTNLQSFRKDMVGANPFKELQNERDSQEWAKANQDSAGKTDRKRSNSVNTEASSEYEEESESENDDDDEDDDIMRELLNTGRGDKIKKYRVLRKLAWSRDLVKDKIDQIRGGFNSENRANRSVAKE